MPDPAIQIPYQVPEQIAATNVKWTYEESHSGNDILFSGRVSNSHPEYTLEDTAVIARMLDGDQKLIKEVRIQVGSGTLLPGESINYSEKTPDEDNFKYYTLLLTYKWKIK